MLLLTQARSGQSIGREWTMSDTTTAEDRCRGVLVGLAAGDQIGGPIRMALRLAESLLGCGGFDPADILNRYLLLWPQ